MCAVADDCNGGVCVEGEGRSFCSRVCGGGNGGCPGGYACTDVGEVSVCLPDTPDGGGGDLGAACEMNGDCNSDVCVDDGQRSFCSQLCGGADGPCPGAYRCVDAGQVNVCAPAQGGGGGLGDACERNGDCNSDVCVDDGQRSFCSQLCGGADGPCPGAYQCVDAGQVNVCVPAQGGGGMSCAALLQCLIDCGDSEACQQQCINGSTDSAVARLNELLQCFERTGCMGEACNRACGNEIAACNAD
jgi:hypothetical protein